MHTVYNNTHNTCKNESKHSEMGPVRQNPIQGTVSLFICVCIALCTIVAHNIAQNRPDSFPPYPPDDHHSSDDVYASTNGEQPRPPPASFVAPVGDDLSLRHVRAAAHAARPDRRTCFVVVITSRLISFRLPFSCSTAEPRLSDSL